MMQQIGSTDWEAIVITESFIVSRYEALLSQAKSAARTWAIEPTRLSIIASKGVFGVATSDGEIKINPAFLGTTAMQKLDQTILHELAHMVVGLRHSHNKRWKLAAYAIGMSFDYLEAQEQQVINNVAFKYTLYAHLQNGERRLLGGVHRKTKKYEAYPAKTLHRTRDGIGVVRYEFECRY